LIYLFRALVSSRRPGAPGDWLACCAWSLAAFAVAVWVFRRWGADLGERI